MGDNPSPYLGDSIDLTGDLDSFGISELKSDSFSEF
jgi:hypothetical protein